MRVKDPTSMESERKVGKRGNFAKEKESVSKGKLRRGFAPLGETAKQEEEEGERERCRKNKKSQNVKLNEEIYQRLGKKGKQMGT